MHSITVLSHITITYTLLRSLREGYKFLIATVVYLLPLLSGKGNKDNAPRSNYWQSGTQICKPGAKPYLNKLSKKEI